MFAVAVRIVTASLNVIVLKNNNINKKFRECMIQLSCTFYYENNCHDKEPLGLFFV